jgi:23S rRNA (cytosine1962-C5)-methyltransferase
MLAPRDSFLVLNLYSNGYSAVLAETLVRTAFGADGTLACGESVLRDGFGKALPLSVFTRLRR